MIEAAINDAHGCTEPDRKPASVEGVTGRIVSNRSCLLGKSASFVRHTVIDVGGSPLEGRFRVGQAFAVVPPDTGGKVHEVRRYSLACPTGGEDGSGRLISTTTKRAIAEAHLPGTDRRQLSFGVCSNYLCDLGPGDEVQIAGLTETRLVPPGNPSQHHFLLVATGTGIAPFRGMLLDLLDGSDPVASRICLVMGAPYTTDLIYHDLFERLDREHDNFEYHTAISREPRPGGRSGLYVHDYLDEHIAHFGPLLADPRTLVYACGLAGMKRGLLGVIAQHGLADGYFEPSEALEPVESRKRNAAAVSDTARPTDRLLIEVY